MKQNEVERVKRHIKALQGSHQKLALRVEELSQLPRLAEAEKQQLSQLKRKKLAKKTLLVAKQSHLAELTKTAVQPQLQVILAPCCADSTSDNDDISHSVAAE